MNPIPQGEDIALAALAATFRNLPSSLRDSIQPEWKLGAVNQPEWVSRPKIGVHHDRIRLMPPRRLRRPVDFWNGVICFYELGVGSYPAGTGSLVQFLMGGNQARCGGGRYNPAVDAILRVTSAKRPEFRYRPITIDPYVSFVKSSSSTDAEQMGRDMAWLIAETLPKFLELSDSGEAK